MAINIVWTTAGAIKGLNILNITAIKLRSLVYGDLAKFGLFNRHFIADILSCKDFPSSKLYFFI